MWAVIFHVFLFGALLTEMQVTLRKYPKSSSYPFPPILGQAFLFDPPFSLHSCIIPIYTPHLRCNIIFCCSDAIVREREIITFDALCYFIDCWFGKNQATADLTTRWRIERDASRVRLESSPQDEAEELSHLWLCWKVKCLCESYSVLFKNYLNSGGTPVFCIYWMKLKTEFALYCY